ncbi:MAG: Gfo/Idh/MocA family oxidoreductase [Verrucomicrobiae bacterium]|nr:Gfo/Idh/MocA family oxidoreductase [Verrucomicrobiae bacterium]
MGRNSPLRIGVAGLGFGAAVHVPGLRESGDFEVVSLLARNPEKGRLAAATLNIPSVHSEAEEFLAGDLDAVSVALPPPASVDLCRRALARKLPVLSEKPLAPDVPSAESLASLAKGIPTMLDFQFMELEAFQKLKLLIDESALGELWYVEVRWVVQSYSHQNRIWSWKNDARHGGGVMGLLGSHLLFLMDWILGEISGLQAAASNSRNAAFCPAGADPAMDSVSLCLRTRACSCVSAILSNSAPLHEGHLWRIHGARGILTLSNVTRDYMNGFELTLSDAQGTRVIIPTPAPAEQDGRIPPFRALARRFARAIRAGEIPHPSFADGLRVQRYLAQTPA